MNDGWVKPRGPRMTNAVPVGQSGCGEASTRDIRVLENSSIEEQSRGSSTPHAPFGRVAALFI